MSGLEKQLPVWQYFIWAHSRPDIFDDQKVLDNNLILYIYIYICCLYRQSYILLGSIKRYIHYAVCLYYVCTIIQLCFQASKRFFSVISSLTRIVGSELGVSEREDAKVAYA